MVLSKFTKHWVKYLDDYENTISLIEKKITNRIGNLENRFIGYGGSCVAFIDVNPEMVLKLCLKKNCSILMQKSSDFINYSKFLIEHDIKILPINEIIYEDDFFLVYTQNKCYKLAENYINTFIIIKILKIVRNLLYHKIKIPDLYIKNFGIYQNDIYLYDYHNFSFFFSEDNLYISHLAYMFDLYFNGSKKFNIISTDKIIIENCYDNILPKEVISFLSDLYYFHIDEAISFIDKFIADNSIKMTKHYNSYQKFFIDDNGIINLISHTLEKYEMFNIIMYSEPNLRTSSFTVCDYGCCIGGIGIKIAQEYPKAEVKLINISDSEINTCNDIINNLCIKNVKTVKENMVNDKNSYDICLYYAIIHHIMKNKKFIDIIKIVYSQTRKYAIIEIPFGNDSLLKEVMKGATLNHKDSYYYLESTEIFINSVSPYFDIIKMKKIDYSSNDLIRYAFLLRKRDQKTNT